MAWKSTIIDGLRIQPGAQVLDMSCGVGADALDLAAKVGTNGLVGGVADPIRQPAKRPT